MTYTEKEEAILACHSYFSKMTEERVGLPLPGLTFGMMDDLMSKIDERLEYYK